MMDKIDIAHAPRDGSWILGYDPTDGPTRGISRIDSWPWVILTMCDEGWRDDHGYIFHPTHFLPLPDPQPKATGWRPAEGVVKVARIIREDNVDVAGLGRFMVYIALPNGEDDLSREPDICRSEEDARRMLVYRSTQLGLPIGDDAEDVFAFSALRRPKDNVVPLRRPA